MFIIEGRSAKAELRTPDEFEGIVAKVAAAGFLPVLRTGIASFATAAGLSTGAVRPEALFPNSRYYPPGETQRPLPEIFFRPGSASAHLVVPDRMQLVAWEIRHHQGERAEDEFCAIVHEAASASLDGRRFRGMVFDWTPVTTGPGNGRVRRPRPMQRSRAREEVTLSATNPNRDPGETKLAFMLANGDLRKFMIRLSSVGKMVADESKIQAKDLDQLLVAGLIRKEYLLRCRLDSHEIGAIDDLTSLSYASIRCTNCGRPLADEVAQDVIVVTDRAHSMLNGSRWMTVWMTEVLIDAGVPEVDIKWNATAGVDEIDVIVNLNGFQLFVELKDRDFGLGDAYRFAPRLERYGGDFGLVVATDPIDDEAKRHLDRQESQILTAGGPIDLAGEVEKIVDSFSRSVVDELVQGIWANTSLDFSTLFTPWMEHVAATAAARKPPREIPSLTPDRNQASDLTVLPVKTTAEEALSGEGSVVAP